MSEAYCINRNCLLEAEEGSSYCTGCFASLTVEPKMGGAEYDCGTPIREAPPTVNISREPDNYMNLARYHVHNYGGSGELEDYVNSHDGEIEELVALALEANMDQLQATIADKDAEIARLLAVEVAAKIMAGPSNVRYSPESQDMAAYQCLTCHSSWDKKSDPVHASSCPVLVINPIGDKHE